MHVRVAHAFADLGLSHVFEESKGKDGALLVRQCGYQGTYRFDVEHLFQSGIDIAQSVSDRLELVVWSGLHVG